MTPTDVDDLVRCLISGDPAAAAAISRDALTSTEPIVLVAAALLAPHDEDLLRRAVAAARRPADRQITALAAAHLTGDLDRVSGLAREHLLDHPDSVLAAWIANGAGTAATRPRPITPPLEKP